jgi:hypothetical protein
MQMKNNRGEVVAEQSVGITKDGSTISVNTMYDNGRPVVQNIGVRDTQGNVRSESILGGKLLP